MIVYPISHASLSEFSAGKDLPHEWERARYIVMAALSIREQIKEFKDWDGYGEYWLYHLPKCGNLIIVRPNGNPFCGGYVVSPVELPWLKGEPCPPLGYPL